MPQKVEIDGVEQTVYSEDEVKPLKTASEEAVKHKESLEKLGKELIEFCKKEDTWHISKF
jgi:hypothetical protein